jgi:NAD(P)-dependent dehydrogenase (short-subunit alcohol dehydrogenase family)
MARDHTSLVSRLGDFTEVADLVAFLASPRASYIYAASLQIDGV